MKIYLTRHGQTIENVEGRLAGHLPGTLSEIGIEQAKRIAMRLRDEKIDFAYSSDLKRAKDTALEILKYHNVCTIFTNGLRERYLGSYEGRLKIDCPRTKNATSGNFESFDGETLSDVYLRAQNFLKSIKERHANQNLLIVGHKEINRGLIGIILGKPLGECRSIPVQENCSLSIFNIDNGKTIVELLNCTKHLF